MGIRRLLILVGASLLLVAGWGLGQKVNAARAITVTPTSVSQTVQPGTTYNGEFKVINQGDEPFNFKIYSTPYRVNGEDYTPAFTVTPGTTQVQDWFNFGTTQGSLTPNQTATIPYTITVPSETPAGGYYAIAFAETVVSGSSGVTTNERVGKIFYLQVGGSNGQGGGVVDWQVNPLQSSKLSTTARVQNSGGSHFEATVQINVTDIFGNSKFKLNTKKYVLPQTIRRIDAPWQNPPFLGIFKAQGSVTILGKTYNLPTRYVLVVSEPMRVILAIVAIVLVSGFFYRKNLTKKAAAKPADKE